MKQIKLNITQSELSHLTNSLEASTDFWAGELDEMTALLTRMKKLGENAEKPKAPRKRKTKAEKAAEAWPVAEFAKKDAAS